MRCDLECFNFEILNICMVQRYDIDIIFEDLFEIFGLNGLKIMRGLAV